MTDILVIDDDPAIVHLIEYSLRRRGYMVRAAENGREGLRRIEEKMPDLVILDVMMPEMDGWETCQRIRRDSNVPILMLTARSEEDDIVQGLELGADEYVAKPFSMRELLARMEATLRRAELGRQQGLAEAETQMEHLRRVILRNVSHELRTPLTLILTNLQLALKNRFGDDIEGQQRFIQAAIDSTYHLHNLIEDLIVLSALDQGEVEAIRQVIKLRFDFHKPIEQCLQRWQERHLDVRIIVEPNVTIHASRDRFKHAVAHLVDNACKFSPEGGRVNIHLAANGEGGCVLVVADEGPGIPVELREKVFERYYQVSQGDAREYGGLGVGLTIARAFARMYGGDVVILDSDTGCCVQMTLPPAPTSWETGTETFAKLPSRGFSNTL